jgi:hypothetical protein
VTTPDNVGGLLLCPFCGDYGAEVAESAVPSIKGGQKRAVYCNGCFCEGPTADADEAAISAWNRRTILMKSAEENKDSELCRAAPAGGECQHEWQPDADVMNARYCPKCDVTQTLPRKSTKDSAPAGSGEVEDENIANIESFAGVLERMALCNPRTADDFNLSQSARHIRDYAALLRKLQQGADAPKES